MKPPPAPPARAPARAAAPAPARKPPNNAAATQLLDAQEAARVARAVDGGEDPTNLAGPEVAEAVRRQLAPAENDATILGVPELVAQIRAQLLAEGRDPDAEHDGDSFEPESGVRDRVDGNADLEVDLEGSEARRGALSDPELDALLDNPSDAGNSAGEDWDPPPTGPEGEAEDLEGGTDMLPAPAPAPVARAKAAPLPDRAPALRGASSAAPSVTPAVQPPPAAARAPSAPAPSPTPTGKAARTLAPMPTLPNGPEVLLPGAVKPPVRTHRVGTSDGKLLLAVPDGALVTVEGHPAGHGSVLLVGLAPQGKVAVEVGHPGYGTWRSMVSLGGRATGQVKVELRRG